MANSRHKSSGSAAKVRAGSNIIFVICVLILIAALVFLYLHHRHRRAQFLAMQSEVSLFEELYELEPRITQDTPEETTMSKN